MPNNEALQVFYGSLPLIVVLLGAFLRQQSLAKRDTMLLQSILDRLKAIEARLVTLETRAGIIYHD